MKNDNMILSDQTNTKEYQIPELVDLNNVSEGMGAGGCGSGSSNAFLCSAGAGN